MDIKLKGENITLRKLKRSDAESIYKNVKDPVIAKYLPLPKPYKLEHAKDLIGKTQKGIRKRTSFELGISLKGEDTIIGMIGLLKVNFENRSAEIGFWLGKKYWGKKIMKEAVRLMLDFAFKELKLVRVYTKVMHPNTASAKLLEKSGFKYEGRFRKTIFRNGKWLDDLRYAIIDEDFE